MITNRQIEALEAEADNALDRVMAAICQIALTGGFRDTNFSDGDRARLRRMTARQARNECARVIAEASGRSDGA